MKVLTIIESFGHGGAETVATDLMLGMREHEHRFITFSAVNGRMAHPPFMEALKAAGIPTHDVHWSLGRGGLDAALSDGWRPDVLLAHWTHGEALTHWKVALNERSPHMTSICVIHDSRDAAPLEFDWYVPVSPMLLPKLKQQHADRVRVIPNGIDLRRFDGIQPHEALPGQPLVIGRVSNLRLEKIPRDMVQTMAGWAIPGARFVIAGDGVLRPALERAITRLGLQDTVQLLGYVPRENIPRVLSTFDLFCYVSSTAVECHPLALLEAAAAGLPIVAEPRGGNLDIVEHGVTGLLGSSPEEIGAHLRTLCADAELRRQMGHNARLLAERHSLERQFAAYRALLADAVAARAVAA